MGGTSYSSEAIGLLLLRLIVVVVGLAARGSRATYLCLHSLGYFHSFPGQLDPRSKQAHMSIPSTSPCIPDGSRGNG